MKIITPKEQIRKSFFEKHLDFLTSVAQRRLQEMILSSCVKGNSGKMTDYAETGPIHRTTYSHFLSKGKWDDARLEETQKCESFQAGTELAQTNKMPVFVRATIAIDRLQLVLAQAHFFFSLGLILPFSNGLRLCGSCCFGAF